MYRSLFVIITIFTILFLSIHEHKRRSPPLLSIFISFRSLDSLARFTQKSFMFWCYCEWDPPSFQFISWKICYFYINSLLGFVCCSSILLCAKSVYQVEELPRGVLCMKSFADRDALSSYFPSFLYFTLLVWLGALIGHTHQEICPFSYIFPVFLKYKISKCSPTILWILLESLSTLPFQV